MELTVNEGIDNNVEVMEKVKLIEVADIIAGQSPPSDTYNKDKVGLPFFQGKTDFGYQNPTPRTWCSQPLKIAEPQDILVSVRAPVGSVNINTENACIGRGIMSVRAKKRAERRHASREKLIHQKYLYYYFIKFEEQIEALGTGSTFKAIKKSELENLEIPLPPLPTQQKIAEILDTADQLRQYNKQLIEKYDALTQSLFLEMFGDPVRNEKGWEKSAVINYCTCIVPGRDKPKSFTGNIPWVTTDDLIQLGKTYNSKKNIGLTEDEILNVRAKKIPIGSVIMTCVGNLGVITINEVEMIINQQLHAFQCLNELNNLFLMHCLSYQKSYMYKMASSTTVPYMNKTVCNNIPIIVPPIELQNQFSERVQLIETQKQQAQEALAKSEDLFQGLLQQAFKGELN